MIVMTFLEEESFDSFKKYIDLYLSLELLIPHGDLHLDLFLARLLLPSRVLAPLLYLRILCLLLLMHGLGTWQGGLHDAGVQVDELVVLERLREQLPRVDPRVQQDQPCLRVVLLHLI
jgi:hypothetical protein